MNKYLCDSVFLVLKNTIGLLDLFQCVLMGNEWRGVYLSLLDEFQYLIAVIAIHTSGLEGDVLAIHHRQG